MFIFVMLSCLFLAALWSPAGKGLTSWLSCVLCFHVFGHFPIWCSGQVWYLFVSIPHLCLLCYLDSENKSPGILYEVSVRAASNVVFV